MQFFKGFLFGFFILLFFFLGLFSSKFAQLWLSKEQITIKQNIIANVQAANDSFRAYPTFSSSNRLRNLENLDENLRTDLSENYQAVAKIAQESGLCKDTGFEISPLINYQNGEQKQLGYNFFARLECTFVNQAAMNELLQKMRENLHPDILLNTPKFTQILSTKECNKYSDLLEIKLIANINERAKNLQNQLNKICKISKIEQNYPRSAQIFAAKNGDQFDNFDFELNANVTFECF